jgi:hypothetical protein
MKLFNELTKVCQFKQTATITRSPVKPKIMFTQTVSDTKELKVLVVMILTI